MDYSQYKTFADRPQPLSITDPTPVARLKMDVIIRARSKFVPPMTYEKIGWLLNLSRERVSQLHRRALRIERYEQVHV